MPSGKRLEWTEEMHRFCFENTHLPRRELAVLFNERFGTDHSHERIRGFCKRCGYMTSRGGTFVSGHRTWNKGMTGLHLSTRTEFPKGHMPHNWHPVGTELKMTPKANTLGYWKVKVGEPKEWRFKHLVIWEAEHGPVPDGHVVIFLDSNVDNFDLDNLVLVTRGELAIMNKLHGWSSVPLHERQTILLLARLQYVSGRLQRGETMESTENSLKSLCKARGMLYCTVCARIRTGWSVEAALNTPVETCRRPRDMRRRQRAEA